MKVVMSPAEKAAVKRIRAAVLELNEALQELRDESGETATITPRARYSHDSGFAAVSVELLTGRVEIE